MRIDVSVDRFGIQGRFARSRNPSRFTPSRHRVRAHRPLVVETLGKIQRVGIALGLVAAWFTPRALQAQLTGFDASPLWPYLAVGAGMLALMQPACLIPPRRAAKLDGQTVLSSA
jgi:hypothetical protein